MKRIAELRDLSDDHHTALVLARRCRKAGDPESPLPPGTVWGEVLEAFEGHLEPHFEIEERHLLPALDAIGEHALAQRIRDDHASLRALRDAGDGGDGGDGGRDRLARFARILEAHVRFEEREVFASTQHRLPPAALQAIARECASLPRTCPASLKT